MTHRERVLTAMKHVEPDRVPLFYRDVPEVERRLLSDLHLADREALLEFFDIDFRWVGPEYIGPPLENEATGHVKDIWGVEFRYVPYSDTAGYWEPVARPLIDAEDPAALEDWQWPRLEWFDFDCIAEQISIYDQYALMTSPGFASPGILQTPIQNLVGEERAWSDLIANSAFFDALVEKILEFELKRAQ